MKPNAKKIGLSASQEEYIHEAVVSLQQGLLLDGSVASYGIINAVVSDIALGFFQAGYEVGKKFRKKRS